MSVHWAGTCVAMGRTVRTLLVPIDVSCVVGVVSGEQLMASAAQVHRQAALFNYAFFIIRMIFTVSSSFLELTCNVFSVAQM